jgi:hypothetical protein
MLSWIIQITIISIVLIFLIHHIINFLKSTLTVPKIKDLVNVPIQKYENIYNIINNSTESNSNYENTNSKKSNNYTLIDLLPQNEEIDMKSELKNFLKSQLNTINTNDKNEILSLEPNSNFYSNY